MTCLRSVFFFALLTTACGGSTDGDSGTGGAGTGGTGTGGTGTGGTGAGGSGGASASGGSSGIGVSTGGSGGAVNACSTDSDCGEGICGFAIKDGCSAVGECFPTPGPLCDAYSPGCACDGTVVSVICEGLPDGYAKKPLEHVGACKQSGPFQCGDALTCDSASQYCKIAMGGPCCPPPSYSCEAIPADCTDDYSCSCIQSAVGAQMCDDSGDGVTVTFQYP
jgi:hypothetical protein